MTSLQQNEVERNCEVLPVEFYRKFTTELKKNLLTHERRGVSSETEIRQEGHHLAEKTLQQFEAKMMSECGREGKERIKREKENLKQRCLEFLEKRLDIWRTLKDKNREDREREIRRLKREAERKFLDNYSLQYIANNEKYAKMMREKADEMQTHQKNVNISRIVGASAGILGSAAAIGIVLAPFTMGASLIVAGAIGGAAVAGVGGAVAAGATFTLMGLGATALKEIEKKLRSHYEQTKRIIDAVQAIEAYSSALTELEEETSAVSVVGGVAGVARVAKGVGGAAVSTIGALTTVAASGLRVAGIALAALGAAVDVIFIIVNAVKIAKGNKSEIASKFREAAKGLEKAQKAFENIKRAL